MNKKVLLVIGLISMKAFAIVSLKERTEIFLTMTSNLKMSSSYHWIVDEKSLTFNSEKIDPLQLPRLIKALKVLSSISTSTTHLEHCSAGQFTHVVMKKNHESKQVGCLNSSRSDQLSQSLEVFKATQLL